MITKYQEMAKTGDIRPSRFVSAVSVMLYFYLFVGGIVISIPILYFIFTNKEAFFNLAKMDSTTDILNEFVPPLANYIITNLSIYFMLFGVFIAVKFIHNRPFKTLITTKPKIQWGRFFIGFFVYGIILLIETAVEYMISPDSYSITFDASKFWVALPIILLMTPLQASTEEFVFRGYVIQGCGLKIKNGIVLAIVSGVLFTIPHLANPEIYASNKLGVFDTICAVLTYFIMGAIFALITIKTNSLEAAMGAHTVNNLYCFLLVGYPDGALPTNTVFFQASFNPVSSLFTTIIIGALFYFITAALIRESKDISLIPKASQQDIITETHEG